MSGQRGEVFKRHGSWHYRLYVTERGQRKRRTRGGFNTKGEASAALNRTLTNDRLGPELGREVYSEPVSLEELITEFLDQHAGEESTKHTLRVRLRYATRAFDGRDVSSLTVREVRAWRSQLPKKSAAGVHQALRQLLQYALSIGLVRENVAAQTPNPRARREEITPFGSWEELNGIAAEMDPRYAAIPIFVTGTGLRPQEWIALERADIDREERVVHVRRTFAYGKLRRYGKTERSRRRVPLRAQSLAALDSAPARMDTVVLFPSPDGRHLDLHNWRVRVWDPAFRAAGIDHRRPYDMRHTFATFAIAAGVSLYYLARFMGTSVQMIDRTYGHLFSDAEAEVRDLLNLWDGRALGADREAK